MSVGEDAARRTLRSDTALVALNSAAVYRLPVYLACTALALLINFLIGKEMAWDTLNYHLYAGFSALHDRFAQDYFAAGPQTYFNPYAYVPFYAMVSAGLPDLLIGSLLALAHSFILWMVFELALIAHPSGSGTRRTTFALCAVALATVNPILIQQLGASFADITTAELVLAGWVLLAAAVRTPSLARVVAAALLLGAATALKPTNAVHAVAAAVVLAALPGPLTERIRSAVLYVAVLGVSFAAVALPWSFRLAERFGNPFFPLMNSVFRSPEFTTEPLRHYRFIPSSLGEALWRPFAMLNPVSMVHEEVRAPDLRYALLLVLACGLVLQWLWRRSARQPHALRPGSVVDARVLTALGCAFAVDWALWLTASGNGRYFLPMGCVASVLVIGLLFRLCGTHAKLRNYVLVALFAVQAVQLWMGTEFRWMSVPWSGGKWFEVEVPARLTSEPSLYLTMGAQSNSFVMPYLASGSGLIDFSGGYPLQATGANGEQVKALLRRYAPRLRLIEHGERLYTDAEQRAPSISEVNSALRRFGLRADPGDCERITVRGLPPGLEFTIVTSTRPAKPAASAPPDTTYFVSCALTSAPDDGATSADMARQQAADRVFGRLEDACPALFQPRRLPTDMRGDSARRLYINTDLIAWVSYGWVKFFDPLRGDDMVSLGRASDWEKGSPRLVCGRRDGHYFARVLDWQGTR